MDLKSGISILSLRCVGRAAIVDGQVRRRPAPAIPFWPFVFKNVRLFFLGSDDFPAEAKLAAAGALSETLAEGEWPGFEVEAHFRSSRLPGRTRQSRSGGCRGEL